MEAMQCPSLVEEIIENEEEIKQDLTPEQKMALDIVLRGNNVFITGKAGTGKTHLIHIIKYELEKLNKKVALTAMTGIAASNIQGVTLHSFAGFGLEIKEKQHVKPCIRERWKEIDVLIIDEISIADFNYFESLSQIVSKIRQPRQKTKRSAFGGLQIIMIGDFFQLPPVNKDPNTETRYVFEGQTWKQLKLKYVILTTNMRQKGDRRYGELCDRIREGKISIDDIRLLKGRENVDIGNSIVLTSRSEEADKINQQQLLRLMEALKNRPGINKQRYMTRIEMPKDAMVDVRGRRLDENYWKQKASKMIPIDDCFELCLGSEVLLCVNMLKSRLCNGSRGKIIDFKEASNRDKELGFYYYPVVQFENGITKAIRPYNWRIKMPIPLELIDDGRINLERAGKSMVLIPVYNIPLKHGDAITIHKSQGLTLDRARVKLENVFTHSQVYVALSRVTSIDGLSIIGTFDPQKIQVDRKVYDFQATIEQHIARDLLDIGSFFSKRWSKTTTTTTTTTTKLLASSDSSDLLDDLDFDKATILPSNNGGAGAGANTVTTTTTTTNRFHFKVAEEAKVQPIKKRKRDLTDFDILDDINLEEHFAHGTKYHIFIYTHTNTCAEQSRIQREDDGSIKTAPPKRTKTQELFDTADQLMHNPNDDDSSINNRSLMHPSNEPKKQKNHGLLDTTSKQQQLYDVDLF